MSFEKRIGTIVEKDGIKYMTCSGHVDGMKIPDFEVPYFQNFEEMQNIVNKGLASEATLSKHAFENLVIATRRRNAKKIRKLRPNALVVARISGSFDQDDWDYIHEFPQAQQGKAIYDLVLERYNEELKQLP